MSVRKKRLRPGVKVFLFLFSFTIIFFALNKKARARCFPYFDTRCLDYKQRDYSRRLNDRIVDYGPVARRLGIKACADNDDLENRISAGKLVKVRTCRLYIVDRMTHSSPYVTRDSKELIDEIARRFREKTEAKGLKGVRFVITSMTRQTENVKNLRKLNSNSSENSPHLYGNAFDISYKRITARKFILTNCDNKYLKDALGEVIWKLKQEKKCWATYERSQNCYHIVAR
jgi:uncharacterized protein YcbK (DUF882 family)